MLLVVVLMMVECLLVFGQETKRLRKTENALASSQKNANSESEIP